VYVCVEVECEQGLIFCWNPFVGNDRAIRDDWGQSLFFFHVKGSIGFGDSGFSKCILNASGNCSYLIVELS